MSKKKPLLDAPPLEIPARPRQCDWCRRPLATNQGRKYCSQCGHNPAIRTEGCDCDRCRDAWRKLEAEQQRAKDRRRRVGKGGRR